MSLDSDKWGWKQVTVVGEYHRGSSTKKWKCKHCHQRYNGSYSRVRAHLLGFYGWGVKSCDAIDASTREGFRLLDEDELARRLAKQKTLSSIGNTIKKSSQPKQKTNHQELPPHIFSASTRTIAKEDVDETVARFFLGDGVDVDVLNSSYFRQMVNALGISGPRYELPAVDQLSGSLLDKEKVRLEKGLAVARDSWPYTGCTILCVNHLDGSLGCFCVNFFVASPRGVTFLKEVDIIEGDGPDNQFINELATAITEVGPSNVVQVITHLNGQASDAFESVILSKFPHIFWSHCSSHSILLLMEEIADLDGMKSVVSCARDIEQCVSAFRTSSFCLNNDILNGSLDPVSQKFAPSYSLVRRILENKATLCDVVITKEWKQWRTNNVSESDGVDIEAVISRGDFWDSCRVMLEVYEPFVRLLISFDEDIKSVMGSVYNWRILSLEALRNKNINDVLLNQLESLVEKRWDKLFSPLHGAAYILHPKYQGKGQSKDKSLMRAWIATLERYELDVEARRVLREELGSYWRVEGSFGERDAVECRDKMEPVTWWENFGFETPCLQSLAIKILSQIPSSVIICEESWHCDNMPCKEAVQRFGLGSERAKDFVFVRNNLRLQSLRNRKVGYQFSSGDRMLCQRV